ncbi:hypothetical protein PCE31107_03979 [Pandoraea cepalis]|uniref:Uncharacterized protein n=1 Tax=Pandoraea cepalis TaxID=2508294 RepID=A0A5E4XN57_9BURK|nr:hypothetical protein PCE31107_03979 [Pandoraea cepalis]
MLLAHSRGAIELRVPMHGETHRPVRIETWSTKLRQKAKRPVVPKHRRAASARTRFAYSTCATPPARTAPPTISAGSAHDIQRVRRATTSKNASAASAPNVAKPIW